MFYPEIISPLRVLISGIAVRSSNSAGAITMAGVVRLGLERPWFLRGWMRIEEIIAPFMSACRLRMYELDAEQLV